MDIRVHRLILMLMMTYLSRDSSVASAADCRVFKADIIFLLDSSGSVGLTNFQFLKQFVANVTDSFDIGPNYVQVGVVTFSSTPRNEFNLNKYTTKSQVLRSINNIRYTVGITRTDLALNYIRYVGFTPAAGDRPDADNILIIMTDGQSDFPSKTIIEAQFTKMKRIKVIMIGIGSRVDQQELLKVATAPDNVLSAKSFGSMHSVFDKLLNSTCSAAIDGNWSSFGRYSKCSRSCGAGVQERVRTCTNPAPSGGGSPCVGSAINRTMCNIAPCPTTPLTSSTVTTTSTTSPTTTPTTTSSTTPSTTPTTTPTTTSSTTSTTTPTTTSKTTSTTTSSTTTPTTTTPTTTPTSTSTTTSTTTTTTTTTPTTTHTTTSTTTSTTTTPTTTTPTTTPTTTSSTTTSPTTTPNKTTSTTTIPTSTATTTTFSTTSTSTTSTTTAKPITTTVTPTSTTRMSRSSETTSDKTRQLLAQDPNANPRMHDGSSNFNLDEEGASHTEKLHMFICIIIGSILSLLLLVNIFIRSCKSNEEKMKKNAVRNLNF